MYSLPLFYLLFPLFSRHPTDRCHAEKRAEPLTVLRLAVLTLFWFPVAVAASDTSPDTVRAASDEPSAADTQLAAQLPAGFSDLDCSVVNPVSFPPDPIIRPLWNFCPFWILSTMLVLKVTILLLLNTSLIWQHRLHIISNSVLLICTYCMDTIAQ